MINYRSLSFRLPSIQETYSHRKSVVHHKMSIKKGFVGLGITVTSAVAEYINLSHGNTLKRKYIRKGDPKSSTLPKMCPKTDLFVALGAAVASAVTGYLVISYGKNQEDLKTKNISKDEPKTKTKNTGNMGSIKKDAQVETINDKDELKRVRDEEEFKAFALFWNSWK